MLDSGNPRDGYEQGVTSCKWGVLRSKLLACICGIGRSTEAAHFASAAFEHDPNKLSWKGLTEDRAGNLRHSSGDTTTAKHGKPSAAKNCNNGGGSTSPLIKRCCAMRLLGVHQRERLRSVRSVRHPSDFREAKSLSILESLAKFYVDFVKM
jgi:hypothetical protein